MTNEEARAEAIEMAASDFFTGSVAVVWTDGKGRYFPYCHHESKYLFPDKYFPGVAVETCEVPFDLEGWVPKWEPYSYFSLLDKRDRKLS